MEAPLSRWWRRTAREWSLPSGSTSVCFTVPSAPSPSSLLSCRFLSFFTSFFHTRSVPVKINSFVKMCLFTDRIGAVQRGALGLRWLRRLDIPRRQGKTCVEGSGFFDPCPALDHMVSSTTIEFPDAWQTWRMVRWSSRCSPSEQT